MLLLLITLKYPRLIKTFFYYEAIIEMAGHFIPQKAHADADIRMQIWMLVTLVNFTLLYSNFKLALPVCILSLVTFQTGTWLVFG